MVFLIITLLVILIAVTLAWTGKSSSRSNRGDSFLPFSGDTSSSSHIHSDHCGHGHDGGAAGGGDCGGGDGGGGSC